MNRDHQRKPPGPATVNRDLAVVRRILNWGLDEGYLNRNPFARLPMARERRKRRPVLSVAEEVKLLHASAPHLVPIVILALDTGMRRGELLHQLGEDVDFERRLIFVSRSKTAEGEMREIPMTNRVFNLLTALGRSRRRLFLYKGEPIRDLKTGWAAAIRRAGIGHYRFHDLRHTFNTRLLEAGVIADTRKALMGHSDGSDVHAIYTHVETPVLRDAIARLDAWYSARLSTLTTSGEDSSLPGSTTPVQEESPE